MSSADSARILRLKIGDKSVQDAGLAGAVKRAFRLALARAGRSFTDLEISLVAMEDVELPLEAMVAALADAQSILLTSGPRERLGVAVMDAPMIASVLEAVTTGSVRTTEPEPRKPTRTDMIICADLLDGILREISVEMMEIPQAPMISDFRYERALTDPAGVELTLENDFYRLFRLRLDISNGARVGELLLCFQAGSAVVGGAGSGRKRNWDKDWREQVDHVPVRVQAIMHRAKMPLRKVTDLKPGDLIEIPRARLEQVILTGTNKKTVARGKLGRQGMNRAIRILDVGVSSGNTAKVEEEFDNADVHSSASGPVDLTEVQAAGNASPVPPSPMSMAAPMPNAMISPMTTPMPMQMPIGAETEES